PVACEPGRRFLPDEPGTVALERFGGPRLAVPAGPARRLLAPGLAQGRTGRQGTSRDLSEDSSHINVLSLDGPRVPPTHGPPRPGSTCRVSARQLSGQPRSSCGPQCRSRPGPGCVRQPSRNQPGASAGPRVPLGSFRGSRRAVVAAPLRCE